MLVSRQDDDTPINLLRWPRAAEGHKFNLVRD